MGIKQMTPDSVEQIGSKLVYVVESHEQVLLPWAIERRAAGKPLILITLDHHTDTNWPFIHRLGSEDDVKSRSLAEIRKFNINDDASMKLCMQEIYNDQQIRAAIMLNIFEYCFVISHEGTQDTPDSNEMNAYSTALPALMMNKFAARSADFSDLPVQPSRPFTYRLPDDRLFIVGHAPGTNSMENPIEDEHLEGRFNIVHEMSQSTGIFQSVFEQDYILDFDLDYFHSMRSMKPQESNLLNKLIRNSRAITIATEPSYVFQLCEDEEMDSEKQLGAMRALIETAVSIQGSA